MFPRCADDGAATAAACRSAPVDDEDEADRSTALAVAVTRSGAQSVYTDKRDGTERDGRERSVYLDLVNVLLAAGADPNHPDTRGMSITMPLKECVGEHCDHVCEHARPQSARKDRSASSRE